VKGRVDDEGRVLTEYRGMNRGGGRRKGKERGTVKEGRKEVIRMAGRRIGQLNFSETKREGDNEDRF
jgi:hypothetical protein